MPVRERIGTERSLRGRVAVVTGGGQGLGEAICRVLAESQARVVVADVAKDRAGALAAALAQDGLEAFDVAMDIRAADQAERGIAAVLDRFGRLDILINNAGVDLTVPIEEMPLDEWDRIMATNLRGPFVLSKLALPIMKRQSGGHIVNITSTAAKRCWANASAYHASKWGLLGFSHALHVEGRPHGIKVTAIVSGGMRTPFLLDRFPDIDTGTLQDPRNVAEAIRCLLLLPEDAVVPEMTIIPMRETSWP
jgi:NAD(P)-dependent dehydrogenase (short-subunit alcohol dehydrogenase family)